MPKPTPQSASSASLEKALRDLESTIEKVPEQYSHLTHPGKNLFYTYTKGIVYGLGALTAVAIIIPLLVWMLRAIPWGPIVGDFVQGIVERIDQADQR